jgi:hypothetical protein
MRRRRRAKYQALGRWAQQHPHAYPWASPSRAIEMVAQVQRMRRHWAARKWTLPPLPDDDFPF